MSTARNPEHTRTTLLQAAFEEIYANGFQGMRVDDVLARTGLKKGAFYHHFASKQDLGYAVLDEVIPRFIEQHWIQGLVSNPDPIQALEYVLDEMAANTDPQELFRGCPLNNLALEMAPLDTGFQVRIEQTFNGLIDTIAEALARGQGNGTVREGIDRQSVAMFIVASIEGCIGVTKASQNLQAFTNCRQGLSAYLQTLKPAA